jgi:TatD DNase family protein
LIDFHCHLDLFADPEAVAAAAEAAKIYVLSVTTTPKAWRKTAALAKGKPHIRTALGLHPQLAHERSNELPLFEALLDETRYVGEIGLDGSPGYGQHADIQMRVFERALSLANERGGRVFSIHSRRAAAEVIATIRKHGCADSSILHWFSGTPDSSLKPWILGAGFRRGRQCFVQIGGAG